MIEDLEGERDELLKRVNSISFDLEERCVELNRFRNEAERLLYEIEGRTLFLEVIGE